MAASRPALPAEYTSRAMMRQAHPLMTTPRMPMRCGGLQSVTSMPNRRGQRSSMGAAGTGTAMPPAARWKPRLPERPRPRPAPGPPHRSTKSMAKGRVTRAPPPRTARGAGGVHEAVGGAGGRPRPATTFETSSAHRTARLRLTASAGARTASKGRSLARTLTWLRLLRRRRLRRLDRYDLDVEEQRLAGEG